MRARAYYRVRERREEAPRGARLFSAHSIHRRTIRDGAGTLWLVAELDARHVPGAVELTCLVFESQAICRRYWHYPADWISLDDESLLGLMAQTRPRN
jgi:hypothetical protein